MVMINLILILLIGGLLAILSERISDTMPRKVAMALVLIDLLYLLICLSGMPCSPLARSTTTRTSHTKTKDDEHAGHSGIDGGPNVPILLRALSR